MTCFETLQRQKKIVQIPFYSKKSGLNYFFFYVYVFINKLLATLL